MNEVSKFTPDIHVDCLGANYPFSCVLRQLCVCGGGSQTNKYWLQPHLAQWKRSRRYRFFKLRALGWEFIM